MESIPIAAEEDHFGENPFCFPPHRRLDLSSGLRVCDTSDVNSPFSIISRRSIFSYDTTEERGRNLIPDVFPVAFHLYGTRIPTAKRVSVLGSFNAWVGPKL
jgi:hypothetical protein